MTTRTAFLSASAFVLATVGSSLPARAQLEPGPTDPAALPPATDAPMAGPELTPVLVAPGTIDIRVPLVIELSKNQAFKQFAIPLDLYYGVNENLTVGLSHSEGTVQSVLPYGLRFGRGICLGGEKNGCPAVYDNIGVDALFGFMKGILQLAGHGGFEVRSLDEGYWALRLGVLFQAPLATNIAIITDPRITLGLNKRDLGNFDDLVLPLAVQLWSGTTRVAVRTGLSGIADEFSDTYEGFLGVFLGLGLSDMVEGFLSFDFGNLYGPTRTADDRTLVVGVNFGM